MNLTILSLALLLVTVNSARPSYEKCRVKECGKTGPNFVATRIVGGRIAREDELPFQVSISLVNSPTNYIWCGGSVINDRWILTAASCFNGEPASMLQVSVGILHSSEIHSQGIPIDYYWTHRYMRGEYEYDIALVKTKKSISASSKHFVSPICLPFEDMDTSKVGDIATVSGFGYTADRGDYSDKLKTTKLEILSQEKCNDEFYLNDPSLMLCAEDSVTNSGTCIGDRGGPLAVKNENGSYVLKGITHYGGCGRKNDVSLFTNVASYMDWICDTMALYGME